MRRADHRSDDLVQVLVWAVRFPVMLVITLLALTAFLLMDLYFWLDGPAHYELTPRSRAIGFSAACASVGGVIPAVGTLVRMVQKRQLSKRCSVSPHETRNIRIATSLIALLVISGGVFAVAIGFGARFAVPLMAVLFLPELSLARGLSERKLGRARGDSTGDA